MSEEEYIKKFFNSLFNKPSSEIGDFVKQFINPHNSMGLILVSDEISVEKRSSNDIPFCIIISSSDMSGCFSIGYHGITHDFEGNNIRSFIFKFTRNNIRNLNINTL